jgi:hypothetical protein
MATHPTPDVLIQAKMRFAAAYPSRTAVENLRSRTGHRTACHLYLLACWPTPARNGGVDKRKIQVATPGNHHWRLQVGSQGEMILLAGLIGLTAALVPLSQVGSRDGLQMLLCNLDITREQFQRQASTHWYALELAATDNLTLQVVQGRFPVVRVWQNGLIVERDGELRAVGASPTHHNLYPLQARLIAGEPLRVVAERVEMRGHTLRWLLSRIDPSRPYYLLGEVEIADCRGPTLAGRLDSVETYNPVLYRGGILPLHYGLARELEPCWIGSRFGARWWCSSGSGPARRRRWGWGRSGYRRSCGGFCEGAERLGCRF